MTPEPVVLPPGAAPIHVLISRVMGDLAPIGKDRQNKEQGYSFRSIDSMYDALNRACAKHGVFTVPRLLDVEVSERDRGANKAPMQVVRTTVEYRFYGPAGDHVEAVTVGQGMDVGDKATNKALTAAHKWALTQVFMPPFTGLDDGDAHSPELPAHVPAEKSRLDVLVERVDALSAEQRAVFDEWKRGHKFKWPWSEPACVAIETQVNKIVGGGGDAPFDDGRAQGSLAASPGPSGEEVGSPDTASTGLPDGPTPNLLDSETF